MKYIWEAADIFPNRRVMIENEETVICGHIDGDVDIECFTPVSLKYGYIHEIRLSRSKAEIATLLNELKAVPKPLAEKKV